MTKILRALCLSSAATMGMAVPSYADELSVICRCVVGGVNSETATWIKESVIPGFTAAMAAEGREITVNLIEFGGQDEQMTQQLALDFSTGAGADVAAFDGFLIPSFVEGGLLKSLEEVAGPAVADWEGWDKIAEGSKALMSYNGVPYGIALGTDVRAVFVRRDLLESAGIEADGWQPASWDELLDAARAIKAANPDSFPLQLNAGVNMGEATTMQGYYMAILGTGQSVVDADGRYIVSSQGILDVLNLYKTIYVDEALGDQRAQLLTDGRNQSFANFRDGRTAMLVEGDWFYNSVLNPGAEFGMDDRNEQVIWAAMPAQEPGAGYRGQDYVTVSGGTGFVINPNTDMPEEAWALLAYMNSQEELTNFQGFREARRIRSDVDTPNNPYLQETQVSLLPLTTARPNDPDYNKVSAEIQRMTESVVSGELSPEEAMAQYRSAVIAIVGEERTVTLD